MRTYNVIHMSMRDEEEVLGDSTLWAASNIERQIKSREDYAGFMASNGQTFNWVAFNGQASGFL